SIASPVHRAKSLRLGPLTIADPFLVEMDLAPLAQAFGQPVAGIVGYDLFSRCVVELTLAEDRLELFDPAIPRPGVDRWRRRSPPPPRRPAARAPADAAAARSGAARPRAGGARRPPPAGPGGPPAGPAAAAGGAGWRPGSVSGRQRSTPGRGIAGSNSSRRSS